MGIVSSCYLFLLSISSISSGFLQISPSAQPGEKEASVTLPSPFPLPEYLMIFSLFLPKPAETLSDSPLLWPRSVVLDLTVPLPDTTGATDILEMLNSSSAKALSASLVQLGSFPGLSRDSSSALETDRRPACRKPALLDPGDLRIAVVAAEMGPCGWSTATWRSR